MPDGGANYPRDLEEGGGFIACKFVRTLSAATIGASCHLAHAIDVAVLGRDQLTQTARPMAAIAPMSPVSCRITTRDNSMAEIGEPERRRVLVPDETPAPTPIVEPVEVPEREPVKIPQREPA